MAKITPKASLGNLFKLSYLDDLGIPTEEFLKDELPKVHDLHPKVRHYLEDAINLCLPAKVHLCDGSEEENKALWKFMKEAGYVVDLPKLENCILARTDPCDVARVESKTIISTVKRSEAIPEHLEGTEGKLGYWMSPNQLSDAIKERFPGCMKGRTMYIVPFSMGVLGSPLAKVGIEITDSAYVACSMRIMTRMGHDVLDWIDHHGGDFIKALHSVGQPLPMAEPPVSNWPCNPEKVMIAHIPSKREIVSFGSGYGGNSLLGKKCFALRIGSTIARDEGWMAEHMLIVGITRPNGKKHYIAAAFPSQCGKTNLAMMNASLPGYKVECVGDDIAWMKFDPDGNLKGVNPENGFFGVAPGTSHATNPNAMESLKKNSIFTNVATTSDGGVFWEGLEKEVDLSNLEVTDWLGRPWKTGSKTPAAHPNARFASPCSQCPIIDPKWEDPEGVKIDAILFGGRRPAGVPLVLESFSWQHGIFLGSCVSSEATAAAEFKGKFLWPGFGENLRVLDWILRRLDGEDIGEKSAIGIIPKEGSINIAGLSPAPDMKELFHLPKDFWLDEVTEMTKYYKEQVGKDLPNEMWRELEDLKKRIETL
ncbi:unnamed protein product [Notodromas monacha]|uniref:Phosphoenolpyruvate carboxykinase [GTP] n=1 Tax=Notodromas monacha TaxID=399045 RepID=A0A7R9BP58_9CRUS|nr:unnamed protein product [Notodromas monacha]CAG0917606.1 unnamed protein product [Notodromas monacha]